MICDRARSVELEERVQEHGGVPLGFVDVYCSGVHVSNMILLLVQALLLCLNISIPQAYRTYTIFAPTTVREQRGADLVAYRHVKCS